MSLLRIRLLGAPRLELDGNDLNLGRRKTEALLAYLAVTGRPHSREHLAALFWPDASQSSASTYLRRSLYELRKQLDSSYVVAHKGSATFVCDNVWLDTTEFQILLDQAQEQPASKLNQRLTLLSNALDLYCGDLMAGFTLPDCPDFDDWQFFEREAYRHDALGALDELIRLHSEFGQLRPAIERARQRLALDSMDESTHRMLMELYARNGQWSAAVQQYQTCVEVLRKELGVSISSETEALYEAIVARAPRLVAARTESLIRTESEAKPSASRVLHVATKHNLPAATTPLIGRHKELKAVGALLSGPEARLLTLVGPGGIGKSRLAIEAARRLLDQYGDGVFLVPLAGLDSAEAMPIVIASALNLELAPGIQPLQQLSRFLQSRHMLLLLDNVEHLRSAAPDLVYLLSSAPGLTLLCTSRARLNVEGEHLFLVEGLTTPPDQQEKEAIAGADAVRLFVEHVRKRSSSFRLDEENMHVVAEICRLVQGTPLGIILAAAWTDMFAPDAIAQRIREDYDFLSADVRDLPERQRSLRALFDWSWALLSRRERQVFARLAVFRGGYTQDAAAAVAQASLRDHRGLMDKSFVQRVADDRFEIHELVRQYGLEALAVDEQDATATRARHAAFFADLLRANVDDLKGPDQKRASNEIEREYGNVRAAWKWACQQERLNLLARALDGLSLFCKHRGYVDEGLELCRLGAQSVERVASAEATVLLARIRLWQGVFYRERGEIGKAQVEWSNSLSLLENPTLVGRDQRKIRAELGWNMGMASVRLSDYDQAHQLYQSSEMLLRDIDAPWELSQVLLEDAIVHWHWNRYAEAQVKIGEAMQISLSLRDPVGQSDSLMGLGLCALNQGFHEESEDYLRRCVSVAEELTDDRVNLAKARTICSWTLIFRGKYDEAVSLVEQAIKTADTLNSPYWSTMGRWTRCLALLHRGDYEIARLESEQGLILSRQQEYLRGTAALLLCQAWIAMATGEIALAESLLMDSIAFFRKIGHMDELAQALAALATARLLRDAPDASGSPLFEALRLAEECGVYQALLAAIPAAALYQKAMGRLSCAERLHSIAAGEPLLVKSIWYADVYGRKLVGSTGLDADQRDYVVKRITGADSLVAAVTAVRRAIEY
ncbi:MAG: AfsR/SARP family transcriptional regulator [Caldilineaceae bacterium]